MLSDEQKQQILEQRMKEIHTAKKALDQEFAEVYGQWLTIWLVHQDERGMMSP